VRRVTRIRFRICSVARGAKIGGPSSLLTELRRTRFAIELIALAAPREARDDPARLRPAGYGAAASNLQPDRYERQDKERAH
jgi:hypothetical protein